MPGRSQCGAVKQATRGRILHFQALIQPPAAHLTYLELSRQGQCTVVVGLEVESERVVSRLAQTVFRESRGWVPATHNFRSNCRRRLEKLEEIWVSFNSLKAPAYNEPAKVRVSCSWASKIAVIDAARG